MNIYTKEDLEKTNHPRLTVKQLKDFIEKNNLADDALVMIQRVEDMYYDGVDISGMRGCQYTENGIFPEGSKSSGWLVYLKGGYHYHQQLKRNKEMLDEIERRQKGEESHYPGIEDPSKYIATEEQLNKLKEQYTPAHCPVVYSDEKHLFIDLHY